MTDTEIQVSKDNQKQNEWRYIYKRGAHMSEALKIILIVVAVILLLAAIIGFIKFPILGVILLLCCIAVVVVAILGYKGIIPSSFNALLGSVALFN
jgi:K+-sensing histidine kinase KdpD